MLSGGMDVDADDMPALAELGSSSAIADRAAPVMVEIHAATAAAPFRNAERIAAVEGRKTEHHPCCARLQ